MIYYSLILLVIQVLCIVLAFDASKSTISGVVSEGTLIINQTYTLTVQAKDTSNNNLVIGGEDIYVRISDPCTRGANTSCVPSTFTQSALNSGEKVQKLTDNADGTYTTIFDLNYIGDATLSVFQIVSEQVLGHYYNNQVISGTPDVTNTSANINFSWGGGITPGHGDVAGRFTGKLTPFQTGAYTLSLYQDNGSTLKINGVELISKFNVDWFGTDTVSYNFNAFETYEVQVDWVDLGGPGGVKLSWNLGSGTFVIPEENYAISYDIGSSPLQISVACPAQREQASSTSNQCRPVCGDGLVVDSESCDDGNVISGDGCSSDCKIIETYWICDNSTPNVCTRDYKSIPFTDQEKGVQAATLSAVLLATGLNIISGVLGQSGGSTLASLNQLQLLILLLLLGIHLPENVINYLRSLSVLFLNLGTDLDFIGILNKLKDWLDYPQERADFDMVDISSGSSLLNMITPIGTLISFCVAHIIMALLICCSKESQKCCARAARYIKKCLAFGMYFSLFFESFITLCLSSFSELDHFSLQKSDSELLSLALAVVFFFLILSMLTFVVILWAITKSTNLDVEKRFVSELFGGLKNSRSARLYPIMFLARRIVLCLMIVFLKNLHKPTFLGIYLGVISVQCILVCITKPFLKTSENITEIINELFYVSFCVFLQWHYLEPQWSHTKGVMYYWCLIGNNITNVLLSLSKFSLTSSLPPVSTSSLLMQIRKPQEVKVSKSTDYQSDYLSQDFPAKEAPEARPKACSCTRSVPEQRCNYNLSDGEKERGFR